MQPRTRVEWGPKSNGTKVVMWSSYCIHSRVSPPNVAYRVDVPMLIFLAGMEWYDWGIAIKGIFRFTQTYDNFEMYFDILGEGSRLIGTGALSEW